MVVEPVQSIFLFVEQSPERRVLFVFQLVRNEIIFVVLLEPGAEHGSSLDHVTDAAAPHSANILRDQQLVII